jgi:hypothetical protein
MLRAKELTELLSSRTQITIIGYVSELQRCGVDVITISLLFLFWKNKSPQKWPEPLHVPIKKF